MKKESRKEVISTIGELLKADMGPNIKPDLRYHFKTGPNGVEITMQIPPDAKYLAEHVKRLAELMVDEAI